MNDVPVLVINSGSSSLKFGLFHCAADGDETGVVEGAASGVGRPDGELVIKDAQGAVLFREAATLPSQGRALRHALEKMRGLKLPEPVAVGHRVVHGGPKLREHQRITPEVLKVLEDAVHFAPLHIPAAVKLIHEAEGAFPELPQFACFDTAFHATMPEKAWHYPLPGALVSEGVQRYGFHGLSYESIVAQMTEVPRRMVVAHLGNGCSVAAIADGKSVDTSMGMTPTGGVVMATRCGDLDPGVLLYLRRAKGMDADAIETMLNHEAGLVGLSGATGDMRDLEAAAGKRDAKAALALEIFDRAVAKTIAGYASVLGGVDVLVFTGGIGEHSSRTRESVVGRLGFMRVGEVKVLPAQEELQIARHCRELLG